MQAGSDFVELVVIVDGAVNSRRLGLIDGAQELHHAEWVASAREDMSLGCTCRSWLLASDGHTLNGIDFGAALAQVHLVLHAGERRGVAIGIETIIEFEDDSQRVQGMSKGLEVPGRLAEEVIARGDLQLE